jgi:hypothetical protein
VKHGVSFTRVNDDAEASLACDGEPRSIPHNTLALIRRETWGDLWLVKVLAWTIQRFKIKSSFSVLRKIDSKHS